uniref:CAZy families GH78 protein n=1 Tax=uncultured Cryptococcus TaxID=526442 RepID=A0A060BQW0_9TREE|nr:CAZy families GH78 protein [uncultured Cryptococcus]
MKRARWIWTDDWTSQDKHDPRLVYFRKKVKLQDPQFGELKISADSRYKLFINNQLVEVGPTKGRSSSLVFG